MGKKHKKHHKSERKAPDDESSLDRPPENKPLKLVLKVAASTTTASGGSFTSSPVQPPQSGHLQDGRVDHEGTPREEKKHKHKKKKKKKDKDREKHRHQGEQENAAGKRPRPHGEAEGETPKKKLATDAKVSAGGADGDQRKREPRACAVREEEDNTILRQGLLYLHTTMQKKDINGFFAYPVTDAIAPGYSAIIHYPMDFSTMLTKIEADEYRNVVEYKKDLIQMFNNAMIYNRPETIYYKEAKRLVQLSQRLFSKDKLLHMKKSLSFLASISLEELGLNAKGEFINEAPSIQEEEQQRLLKEKKKARSLSRFEAIPDNLTPEQILAQAQAAAKHAKAQLSLRSPNTQMGFLRRREDGTTTFNFLNPDNDGKVSETERVVNLGSLVGKLNSGMGSLAGFKEDKRNNVIPVSYLSYGPFSSFAPDYDTSFANVSKEEADILLSAYGDETGLQYAKSVMNFAQGSSDYATKMVDNLLDILTKGEHTKAQRILEQRKHSATEEASKQAEDSSTAAQDQSGADAATDTSEDVDSSAGSSQSKEVTPETFQKKLDQTAALIGNLMQTQTERLSQRPPQHLSHIQGPSDKEVELAERLLKELNKMLKVVNPGDIVEEKKVRSALGIASQPASATTSSSADRESEPQEVTSDPQEIFSDVESNIAEVMTS